ncbi:hypothetical protein SeLEV6574_g02816 [Synchytrium endobioticum]|uniref:t-SNARE coiled-coil homology domain-containing protein n=1 Tax=Synchytrium endobioticum TaxID=286115 RepID=A0A507D716_9FUNG|nr:hypothetical protein SeLEV6574_g02816 [Synchytrium endobioticum]
MSRLRPTSRQYPLDPSASSSSSNNRISNGVATQGTAYALEDHNDSQVDMLAQKMTLLKEISVKIGDEVTYQSSMLNDVESDFHKTRGLLGSTMGRLRKFAKTQNGRWMWYLILFCLLVFLWLYFFRYR